MVTLSKDDVRLVNELANRYGDSFEVRIEENPRAGSTNRDNDYTPFWGGARIQVPVGQCTTGFAWEVGSVQAMLTAAHCAPGGGAVSYTAYPSAGWIQAGYEENWSASLGTQPYTGQSAYLGDVALIRYLATQSAPKIYDGPPASLQHEDVTALAFRRREVNDVVYYNGYATGGHNAEVALVRTSVNYSDDGPNVWARGVVMAIGGCPDHGDSGAPPVKYRSDGTVSALGILSGRANLVMTCYVFFTDIYDVLDGLPGNLSL